MKYTALIVGGLLCLLEVAVVAFYLKTFNGDISIDKQDWATFSQILNGCVMALLTGINIIIFYKISKFIENNANKRTAESNEKANNRAIKQTLFEAQSIITQMRVKHYEELSQLINDIKVDLFKGTPNKNKIDQLKKNLMKIEQSFLFKNDNFEENTILTTLSGKVRDLLKQESCDEKLIEKTVNALTDLIHVVELYITTQMLRDHDVDNYMKDHIGNIDSTFSSMNQFTEKLHKQIAEYTSLKQ